MASRAFLAHARLLPPPAPPTLHLADVLAILTDSGLHLSDPRLQPFSRLLDRTPSLTL